MNNWSNDERREYPWERERRTREEKRARARAREEYMRDLAHHGVLASLKDLRRRSFTSVNLLSDAHRKELGKCKDDVLADLKWDTPLAKMVVEALCWLREKGAIGIVGFSGTDRKKLSKFLARGGRVDVRIFPALSAVEV